MKRVLVAVSLVVLTISCRRHGPELPVRVLYSSQIATLPKLRQWERDFSFTDPRLRNGRPFLVRAITTTNPSQALADKSKDFDLILLKSAAEVPDIPELRKEVGDSFTVCGQATAYIPEWTQDERREGAAQFLQYLSTHCR